MITLLIKSDPINRSIRYSTRTLRSHLRQALDENQGNPIIITAYHHALRKTISFCCGEEDFDYPIDRRINCIEDRLKKAIDRIEDQSIMDRILA